MTPRQKAIDDARVQNAEQAEREAHFINDVWGSDKLRKKSLPARRWVRGANGWYTEPRTKLRRAA